MAVFTGYGGSVKVGNAIIAELGEWGLDISVDTQETESFGDQWKEYVATLKEWSGSCSGRWDMTDATGQKALQDALLGGTTVTIKFYINNAQNYSGTAIIEKISVKSSVDGVVEVDFSFKGTGALTYSAT